MENMRGEKKKYFCRTPAGVTLIHRIVVMRTSEDPIGFEIPTSRFNDHFPNKNEIDAGET